jgi:hypothetical protein
VVPDRGKGEAVMLEIAILMEVPETEVFGRPEQSETGVAPRRVRS